MDTNKKILIGAISAAVVIGGVAIGLILSQTPEKADPAARHHGGRDGTHFRAHGCCFQRDSGYRDLHSRQGFGPVPHPDHG